MKAISLWQPWASAIAIEAKRIETRSWPTSYRGPLAIHAAKRCIGAEQAHLQSLATFRAALWPLDYGWGGPPLPLGCIVAVCRLVDCRPVESFTAQEIGVNRYWPDRKCPFTWSERDMGDYTPGRFGWVLADIRRTQEVPYRGAQGLFDLDQVTSAKLLAAMGGPSWQPLQKEQVDVDLFSQCAEEASHE